MKLGFVSTVLKHSQKSSAGVQEVDKGETHEVRPRTIRAVPI